MALKTMKTWTLNGRIVEYDGRYFYYGGQGLMNRTDGFTTEALARMLADFWERFADLRELMNPQPEC